MTDEVLSVWGVSDGRAGIERQVLSLIYALAEIAPDTLVSVKRLAPRGLQAHLPADLQPLPKLALPRSQRAELAEPWPDIWIACGRRSLPYSLSVKRWSRGRTFVVQCQDPRLNPARFDMVIPPAHDDLRGETVFPILGAPVHFPAEALAQARTRFSSLGEVPGFKCMVVLGGDSKVWKLTPHRAAEIEAQLEMLAKRDVRLWLTASRRTPEAARVRFRAFARRHGFAWWSPDEDAPNPYLGFLQYADAAIITADSTNMIGDAAWFGLPIHLLALDGGSEKFTALHKGFEAVGAARWFLGRVDRWAYPPVREAERAARELLDRYRAARV